MKPKKQVLEITIVTKATFALDELKDLEAWKNDIISYGEIVKEKIKIVSEVQ